jgi:hypothetical protein
MEIMSDQMNSMRRSLSVCFILMSALAISGCSSRLKEENEKIKAENQSLKILNETLTSEVAALKAQTEAQKAELNLAKQNNEAALAQAKAVTEELAQDESARNSRPGKVRFLVTYLYNDFVGHRGVDKAFVTLVPAEANWDGDMTSAEGVGGQYTMTGGDGRAVINNMKPGQYRWFIEALGVTADSNPGSGDSEYAKSAMPYKSRSGGMYKIRSGRVEVFAGEESEVSEDVGSNYF